MFINKSRLIFTQTRQESSIFVMTSYRSVRLQRLFFPVASSYGKNINAGHKQNRCFFFLEIRSITFRVKFESFVEFFYVFIQPVLFLEWSNSVELTMKVIFLE